MQVVERLLVLGVVSLWPDFVNEKQIDANNMLAQVIPTPCGATCTSASRQDLWLQRKCRYGTLHALDAVERMVPLLRECST